MKFEEIKKDIWNELNENGKEELNNFISNNDMKGAMNLHKMVISERNIFMGSFGESFHNPLD